MQTMYPGKVNSPKALTEDIIGASETTIEVSDGSVLPAAPNLAVLGSGENCETILYTVKTGNILSGITRGFQGTAQEWTAETPIGRNFTEYDNAAMQANIAEIAARFIASDSVVYVSKQGSDSSEGTRPFSPKITIGAAMSGLTGGVVRVLDAGTYTEDVTVPNNVMLDAANATIIGAMTVGNGCSVRAAKIMPSANNTTAVTKTGSEISMVDADVWEGRGAAGTLTGTTLAYNSVAGAILYATGRTFNVAENGWAVKDNASDNGHIHLNADDVYLFGDDSVGAEVQGPNSHIVIIAQHIITPNGITGTTALKSSNSSARIEATTNEIIAATAALANTGEVAINCPNITGSLTGSGVSVVGRIVGADADLPVFTGAGGVLGIKTAAEARTALGAAAALQANATVYVSPSGSDSTGDGSETNPYATVSAALASAPKILNGRILIIRVSAGTYPGFNLHSFGNGKVLLYLDGVSFSGAVDFYENTAPIEIFGNFSISADQASAAAFTITTTLCHCHGNLTCTNTSQVSPRSLRVIYGASFIMETGNLELLASGSAAIGLVCSFSEVFLNTVSGNVAIGFYANGGVVRVTSSTLETSTKVLKLSGGEVKTGAGIDLT